MTDRRFRQPVGREVLTDNVAAGLARLSRLLREGSLEDRFWVGWESEAVGTALDEMQRQRSIDLLRLDEATGVSVALLRRARSEIVITIDYEVFDFLGCHRIDVYREMILPTESLMTSCEQFGARLTVMFEIGGYWLFRASDPALAEAIVAQLQDAIRRGHDVQLHVHPHLLPGQGAEYRPRSRRLVVPAYRAIHQALADNPDLFLQAKQDCEELLRVEDASYETIAYRSGKNQVQPHAMVYAALAKAGFCAASNVIAHAHLRRYGNQLGHDYRVAWTDCTPYYPCPEQIGWPADTHQGEILEFPICVAGDRQWRLDSTGGVTLADIYEQQQHHKCPLVMIGHSKGNLQQKTQALRALLQHLAGSGDVSFVRLADAARTWRGVLRYRATTARAESLTTHMLEASDIHTQLTALERRQVATVQQQVLRQLRTQDACHLVIFGCGTGCSLLVPLALHAAGDNRVTLTAIDHDEPALQLAERLAEHLGLGNIRFELPPAASADMVLVLEQGLSRERRDRLLSQALTATKPGGLLVRCRERSSVASSLFAAINDVRLWVSVRWPWLARLLRAFTVHLGRRRRVTRRFPRRIALEAVCEPPFVWDTDQACFSRTNLQLLDTVRLKEQTAFFARNMLLSGEASLQFYALGVPIADASATEAGCQRI